eukprot:5308715-Prymnesium_polylepis.1
MLCGGRAQPRHVSYVSFSATPSEVALRLFGVVNHASGVRQPFHTYSLRQAVRDGLCVDVLAHCTSAGLKLRSFCGAQSIDPSSNPSAVRHDGEAEPGAERRQRQVSPAGRSATPSHV